MKSVSMIPPCMAKWTVKIHEDVSFAKVFIKHVLINWNLIEKTNVINGLMMNWIHGWILLMNEHMQLMLLAVYVVFPKWYDAIYTKANILTI